MRPALSMGDDAAPPPHASLAAAILDGASRFEDGRFLYLGRDGQAREVSYRETLGQARRLVAGLRRDGMQAGDALLIRLSEAKDIVPALWAAAIGGFVAIPSARSAHPGAAAPGEESFGLLKTVFAGFRVLADIAAAPDPTVLDIGQLASGPNLLDAEPAKASDEDLRFAILTSGTTAHPRLVGLSDRAALARWWPQLPDAAHATGFLSWSSFDHVMGVGLAMPNLPLKVHLDAAQFIANPLSWLDALDTTGASHATMTNFGMMLVSRALADNPDRTWRLDRVRKIGIGAESISRKVCGRFYRDLAAFGLRGNALILGYGLSECGPVVGGGTAFPGEASDTGSPPELDRPTRGHAVRIAGEAGSLLSEGEVGRIEVRGPTMTSGYLGDELATAALFTPDRWLRTGDLGVLQEGRLTVVGREKELIIVNARKHTCVAVETAIAERTGFAEVYAAPLTDDGDAGEPAPGAACAVFVVVDPQVQLAPQRAADAVRAATAGAFRFAPRVVALVSQEDLPRTSLGKVRRLALPALLAGLEAAGRVDRLARRNPATAPEPEKADVETRVARIWRVLLGSEGAFDRDADFFALGGDSLLALRLTFMVEDEFGVALRIEQFPAKLSLSELARFLSDPSETRATGASLPSDSGLPDWFFARMRAALEKWPGTPVSSDRLIRRVGAAGQGIPVFWCMQLAEEARHFETTVGMRFPAYAMRSGLGLLDYASPMAAALADRYVEEIGQICKEGPVVIGGTCQGVTVALAVTRRLVAKGREVRLLAAADCRFADYCGASPVPVPVALFAAVGSRFNPYRSFRRPEIGLRKLAPRGFRIETVDASYAKIMLDQAMVDLARGLEAAIVWAASLTPDKMATPVPSPAALYQRRISSQSKALELRAGESFTLAVRLKNVSPIVWEPFETSGLALANHWLSGQGGLLVWSDGHAPLRRSLESGARAFMALQIQAPQVPGKYLLEVDLVEEGIRWFADVSSAPLQIPVEIKPPPSRDRQSPRLPVLAAIYKLADRLPFLTRA